MKSALQNLTCCGELQNDRGDRKLSLLFMGKDVEKLLLTMMKEKLTGLTSGNTVRYLEVYFLLGNLAIKDLNFSFLAFFFFPAITMGHGRIRVMTKRSLTSQELMRR